MLADQIGLSDRHGERLEERGIAIEIAAEFGLFSRGHSLGFPYNAPDGTPTSVKFRKPNKEFLFEPSGKPLTIWLLDRWRDESSETLIITEGEIDTLSFLTAGASCVVSVPNGAPQIFGEGDVTPANDNRFAYLWSGNTLHAALSRFKRFVLATDADAPGQVLRDELAIRLGRDRCWFVTYPEGCKDANDVLVRHGREAVLDLVAQAKPIVPSQLVPFSDIPRTTGVSLSSGWSGLDPHLQFFLPEVTVISGPPNHGKSQFALALCANLARVHGMRGAIIQFEDSVDRHRDDLERYAMAWRNGTGAIISEEPMVWIDRMFRTIAPPESLEESEDKTLAWIYERIDEAVNRHDCKWLLIDPWNEIEHAWRVNETETAYTGKALRQIRALARKYQILVMIIAHPTKSGGLKPPEEMSLYDISGSQYWNSKPDHGILIARSAENKDELVVNIAKCRDYRKRGVPGVVRMKFEPRTATFSFISKA